MSTEPRILILNERDTEHPLAGGAEIHLAEIFKRLASRGYSVRQYSTKFAGAASEARIEYPIGRQGSEQDGVGAIEIERVGNLARYYTSVPGRLSRANRRDEFDCIVDCLNKIPFYSPLFARKPVLALCHHLFGEVAFDQVALPIAAAVWLSERAIPQVYRGTRFLAISESSRDDLIARGIAAEQIQISHPGIDQSHIAVDLETERPRRITYLGRLEAYKRVDLMLQAAAELVDRFPDLEIVVVGRGSERKALERTARRLGLERRTRFTGFVDDHDRDLILANTRVCVFPSRKEGWGLTVIEANAHGTPVVASDVAGLRDSIRDGETGLLVASDAPSAFAEAIWALLEDTETALSMRRDALAWSREFDWERAADDMDRAIRLAIKESK